MKERATAPICERGNDLIAFLYDEVNEREAQDFRQHLANCADCKAELTAFSDIRDSVINWRQESLGIVPARSAVGVQSFSHSMEERKPSALAAIREFFVLSPLWMKGAVAFAGVLFCVVAGLAIAGLREKPAAVVVAGDKPYSADALNAIIEARVQERLQKLNAEKKALATPAIVENIKPTIKRTGNGSKESAVYVPKTKRAPLTRSEREQLAADLRLVLPKDDNDIDLLGEGINQ